jgi:hypothetical protein
MMCVRGVLIILVMVLCVAAHAQAPKLLLRATFDGSCAL